MTRLSLIAIVALALETLTSFQGGHKSPLMDKIPGHYYKYFTPGIDGGTDYYLTIKKYGAYVEIAKTNMNGKKSKSKTIGVWSLRYDTVILMPTKVSFSYDIKTFDCINKKEEGGYFCNRDSLVYKDNALWAVKPSYKEYTRK